MKTRCLRMMLCLVGFTVAFSAAAEDDSQTCAAKHSIALDLCGLHAQLIDASSLDFVSKETRDRVAAKEFERMRALYGRCVKAQVECDRVCASEVEHASLEGEDIFAPLDLQQACRKGPVAVERQKIRQQLQTLRQWLDGDKKARQMQPATTRALVRADDGPQDGTLRVEVGGRRAPAKR